MTHVRLLTFTLTLLICLSGSMGALCQIKNFDKEGRQLIRLSKAGDAIDAHDGEIAQFNGVYYLYGTSYDCGFEWGNKGAPFCGFKVYSSKDLVNWIDKGYLFDAKTPVWQSRCDGKTYGCFRPHVVYNKLNNNYVLWINVYDNVIGYRVFTSKSPVGPFKETAEPELAVNADKPAAGLNNGDHDIFIDDDGRGYIAYTDWRTKGTIVIEKLSNDYLSGTGECVKMVTPGSTEAPALFKRKGRYYVTYSDPNCGYCSGTGTSYRMAGNPLGPWSEGVSISNNSCGGQPSFVSTIKIKSDDIFLYGSDLWNNAAKNEALANYYWAQLKFDTDGSIKPLQCAEAYLKAKVSSLQKRVVASMPEKNYFIPKDTIDKKTQWGQTFVAYRNGRLTKIEMVLFKNHHPDKDLEIYICAIANNKVQMSAPIFKKIIPVADIGWSAKKLTILPGFKVKKGRGYAAILRTTSTVGYYGFLAQKQSKLAGIYLTGSKDDGNTFTKIPGETMHLKTVIKAL
ncbi:family 43 glycosylhydrolase [Mucilaginibacter lutimaris]|uniref:Family 43 glycosylhydrolase n=1 Tax=Mucilaginibacter lutimaris TaxID=931629 RepID=A0ABW2ZBM6_9SPHI